MRERNLNEADQSYHNLRNQPWKGKCYPPPGKRKEHIEHLLAAIKDKLNELKLQLAGMKERMNVEFRIDLEAILGALPLPPPWLQQSAVTAAFVTPGTAMRANTAEVATEAPDTAAKPAVEKTVATPIPPGNPNPPSA